MPPLHEKRADGSPWLVRYGAMTTEARSLDPQHMYDEVSRGILDPIQETLLQYQPFKTDPYEVDPCLLETVPEKSDEPEGRVSYLCRLKPGVMYHNDPCFPGGKGREVVAEDVAYAFQRIADPKVECPVAATLASVVVGLQASMEDGRKGEAYDYATNRVKGIEVLDAHTFKVHLLHPYPQILYWLAMHFTTPVAREAVQYYDGKAHPDGKSGSMETRPLFRFHPVGNGPFLLADHEQNHYYRYVRNPAYHTTVFPTSGWPAEKEAFYRPFAGHSLPLVDEVQLPLFGEIFPIWLLMRQGYLDKMGLFKDAANSAVTSTSELAPKLAARGMRLEKELTPSTFFILFNMQDPVLGKNKKLRQAISCSYDPKGFVEMLYGGAAPVARQLVPPGIFGFNKDAVNPDGPDLERARKLMEDAGYPHGIDPKTGEPLEITFDVTASSSEERQLAEYQQRQLEQTGIKVRIIENTFARMSDKANDGNFQMITSGWGADYPDAENFFFLFTTPNFPPDGANYARYSNPELDHLFDQMSVMENTPERYALIQKMNDLLLEDCPAILTFNKGYYAIGQPWAPTMMSNPMMGSGLKYGFVDSVMRAQKQKEWNPAPKWPLGLAGGLLLAGIGYAMVWNRRRNV